MLLFITCLSTPYVAVPSLVLNTFQSLVALTTVGTLGNYAIHTKESIIFHDLEDSQTKQTPTTNDHDTVNSQEKAINDSSSSSNKN